MFDCDVSDARTLSFVYDCNVSDRAVFFLFHCYVLMCAIFVLPLIVSIVMRAHFCV